MVLLALSFLVVSAAPAFADEWTLQAPPQPETVVEQKLESVSCASATMCMAAGTDNYTEKGFTDIWNGTGWSVTNLIDGALSGISCPSTTWCMTVGEGPGGGVRAFTLKQEGAVWNYEWKTPATPGGGGSVDLEDVSCTSSTACTAVGSYYNGTKTVTLAERWNGTSWSVQTTTNPGSGNAEIYGVSCSSSTSCFAVGIGNGQTFGMSWNGTTWSTSATSNPAGATQSLLSDVSCNSSTACMAVGYYKEAAGWNKAFAERWNGTSWTVQTAASPSGLSGNFSFEDVVCTSSTACTAVGTYGTEKGGTGEDLKGKSLVESYNGTSWSTQTSPNNEAKKFSILTGVSCSAVGACTAVGSAGPEDWWGNGTVPLGMRSVPPPPNTTIVNPVDPTLPATAFSFESTEAGSTFECSLDGAAYSACVAPRTYELLSEGTHVFRVRAVGVGGKDPTPAEKSFQVVIGSKAVTKVKILDDMGRQEVPLATGKWTKTNWVGGIGGSWSGSWHGYGVEGSGLSGAYWNPTTFNGVGATLITAAQVGTGSTPAGQYVGLWLEMPSPSTARSGYEARFTGTNGESTTYKAELSKWVSGVRTILGTKEGVSLPVDSTIALTNADGVLQLWSGSTLTAQILALDSTYHSGYSGIEVNGGAGTYYNIRSGKIDIVAPETFIFGAPPAKSGPDVSFTLFSTESESTFQCSLDGAAYSACTSPREYKGLSLGSHNFKVKAIDPVGNEDLTPAEKAFEVVEFPQTTITSDQLGHLGHQDLPVTFTSSKEGSTFKCSLDGPATPTTPCTSPYSLPAGLADGLHTFRVAAVDKDGNMDPTPAQWEFNPAIYPPAPPSSKLISPEEGRKTASYYTLKAEWGAAPEGGGVAGATFQVKLPSSETFKTVPAKCVIDGEGKPVSWPLPVMSNPGHTEPVFLKVWGCTPFSEAGYPESGLKFRAVFDGGVNAAGASEPVGTEFIKSHNANRVSSDATESIGPVSVDLLTGAFTLKRTDVSIPVPGSETNLEFTRVYDSTISNSLSGYSEVLGGWWQPSTPVEAEYEGSAWQRVEEQVIPATEKVYDEGCVQEWIEEEQEFDKEECLLEEAQPEERWVELFDNYDGSISFNIEGGSYIPPEEAKELKLTKEEGNFVLSDPNGTHTTFVQDGPFDYKPKAVSFQATPTSARMVYVDAEFTGLRLMRMIAPSQPGIACEDWTSIKTPGCRTLEFEYLSPQAWNKSGTIYPSWMKRLAWIRYYTAAPDPKGGEANFSEKVAEYNYFGSGTSEDLLSEEWDPRLPNLKEKYTYSYYNNNRLSTLTPAGEEPWEFDYAYDASEERLKLKTVSRATLLASPTKATTTIAYKVPVSGSGAPYDMSLATVAKLGQSDFAVDATAIFPPTQVPSSPPSDYSHATVHYMDPDGYEVNTASPQLPGASGPSIATSETDMKGNIIRTLSAQNRLTALAAGASSVARSQELDSHSKYSADGTEMQESWGPLHNVRLESGTTAEARTHTMVEYDIGFEPKAGETWPHLPTKETTAAAVNGIDKEAQVSETKYDWALRKPTEQIIDPEVPGGPAELNLRTKTVYDSSGQIVQERQPAANAEGTDAYTTKTVYYTAGTQSEPFSSCGGTLENPKAKAALAGLPCVTYPAAAPAPAESNPQMPWTWHTKYSNLDQPEITEEKTNGVLKRTTTVEFDSAGRPIKTKLTGEGELLPGSKVNYDPNTGIATSQELVCEVSCAGFDTQQLTTTYDKLGRPTEYKDADGNTSKVTYDLLGRSTTISDGKGTQTPTYDGNTSVLTKLVDSAAGTFTATTYNADGQLIEQILPNGLAQQITYDSEGTPIKLRYQKVSGCSSSCTWLEFNREESTAGKVLKETSTLATKEYTYDKAGRLTLAKETPAGQGCTTRAYAFEGTAGKDSNRTSRITRGPKEGGACDTTSAGTKTSYSYDSADRLIGSGVVYDSLGRITSLPSAYSGGGVLSTSYYVNNLTRSQSQDGLTNTYYLDASRRQRERVQSGTKSGTEVYHYAGGSDAPAWTQEGANWTRNVAAVGGSLGATQKSNGEITFQIADMHGDVVATADDDPSATSFLSTQQFDEFGNPKQSTGGKYGWLGVHSRRTELPSGVIQMGVRSYVPALGRFLTPDPVKGGSANTYDYANQDPVNNFDLTGEKCRGKCKKMRKVRQVTERRAKSHGLPSPFRKRCGGGRRACSSLSFIPGDYWGAVGRALGVSDETTGVYKKIVKTAQKVGHEASTAWQLEEMLMGDLSPEERLIGAYSCVSSAAKAFFALPTNFFAFGKKAPLLGWGYLATECVIGAMPEQ